MAAAFRCAATTSSGIPAVDHLLAEAANTTVCRTASDPSSASTSSRVAAGSTGGAGGLPTNAITEIYGPPLSGKSRLLQYAVAAFVRRMQRQQSGRGTSLTKAAAAAAAEDANAGGDGPSTHTAAAQDVDWDVYVCLTDRTVEVTGWSQCVLPAANDTASFSRTSVVGTSATLADHSYVESHVHFVDIDHPNSLLGFLEWISQDRVSSSSSSSQLPCRENQKASNEVPAAHRQRRKACSRSPVPLSPSLSPAPPLQRRRSRVGGGKEVASVSQPTAPPQHVSSPSSPSLPTDVEKMAGSHASPPLTSTGKSTRGLDDGTVQGVCVRGGEHHALIVIDSLSALWMHPALGLNASSHAARWYAAELHRLLRCCLANGVCVDGEYEGEEDIREGDGKRPRSMTSGGVNEIAAAESAREAPQSRSRATNARSASVKTVNDHNKSKAPASPFRPLSSPHPPQPHVHRHQTVTIWTSNSCGYYTYHSAPSSGDAISDRDGKIEEEEQEQEKQQLLPLRWVLHQPQLVQPLLAFPPPPLPPHPQGPELWWSAVDYRLFMEPADPSMVSLPSFPTSSSSAFTGEGMSFKGRCTQGSVLPSRTRKRGRMNGDTRPSASLVQARSRVVVVKGWPRGLLSCLVPYEPPTGH